MNEAVRAPRKSWLDRFGALRWAPLALLVILADQISKGLIVARLRLFDTIPLLPFLELTRLHNTGAAFSFLAGGSGWQRWFFIALAVVVSVAILWWLVRLPPRGQGLLAAGLSLIMGGALGNVIDRIWHGHVVDFIHFHWRQLGFENFNEFPAFNLADTSITIGAGLLILDAILEARRKRRSGAGPASVGTDSRHP